MGHVSEVLNLLRKQAECDHQDIDWSIPPRKKDKILPEGDAQYVARVLKRRTWKNKEYIGVPIRCEVCGAVGTEWYVWDEDEWEE